MNKTKMDIATHSVAMRLSSRLHDIIKTRSDDAGMSLSSYVAALCDRISLLKVTWGQIDIVEKWDRTLGMRIHPAKYRLWKKSAALNRMSVAEWVKTSCERSVLTVTVTVLPPDQYMPDGGSL